MEIERLMQLLLGLMAFTRHATDCPGSEFKSIRLRCRKCGEERTLSDEVDFLWWQEHMRLEHGARLH